MNVNNNIAYDSMQDQNLFILHFLSSFYLDTVWIYTGVSVNYLLKAKTHPMIFVNDQYVTVNWIIERQMFSINELWVGKEVDAYLKYFKVYKVALGFETFKNHQSCNNYIFSLKLYRLKS